MTHFVFWQRAASMHWNAVIRALASRPNTPVTLVTMGDIGDERRHLGWSDPDLGGVRRIFQPSAAVRRELVHPESGPYRTVHIFSGLKAYPDVAQGLRDAIRARANVGIVAEGGDPRGIRGLLRRALYRLHGLHYRHDVSFLLCTGRSAVAWYEGAGFAPAQLVEFGYFVDPTPSTMDDSAVSMNLRILYVGQLIHRKGVDLLLKALARLKHDEWQLEVVGHGPDLDTLRALAAELGISAQVEWAGALENRAVAERIARSDTLVLPSRFDGWGAVVNEALVNGTPVLCSDACGAASLINGPLQGHVFSAGAVDELAQLLDVRIQSGRVTSAQRAQLRAWATCISGEAAASYLEQVVYHFFQGLPRPFPPWAENRSSTILAQSPAAQLK